MAECSFNDYFTGATGTIELKQEVSGNTLYTISTHTEHFMFATSPTALLWFRMQQLVQLSLETYSVCLAVDTSCLFMKEMMLTTVSSGTTYTCHLMRLDTHTYVHIYTE